MGRETTISWCDHTASPWYGCSKVAAGCTNCYAETLSKRNPGTLGVWGDAGVRVKSKSFIDNLRRWNKSAAKRGVIESVFPSMCDPFEDRPELEEWRREMFAVADECQNIRLLLLTKRPENIRRMWPGKASGNEGTQTSYRANCWLLTSIATQADADKNIPELLACRDLVPVLGVSAEPLVESVNLHQHWAHSIHCKSYRGSEVGFDPTAACNCGREQRLLNWIIAGGESGHHARPCDIAWIRSLVAQCKAASVPCFVKQLGAVPYEDDSHLTGSPVDRNSLTRLPGAAMKDPKGGDWSEWPEDLRVREFPTPSPAIPGCGQSR